MQRITLKLGNMKKPQDFVVYPVNRNNPNRRLIQSDKRIAAIDITTGEGLLSDGKGGHQGFHKLQPALGSMAIKVDQETINLITGSTAKSGDTVANGVVRIA